MKSEKPLNIFP